MARPANDKQLDEIRQVIQDYPAHRAGWFARWLGRDNKSVTRALPQLEARGDLLQEDDEGRISWFGRRRH